MKTKPIYRLNVLLVWVALLEVSGVQANRPSQDKIWFPPLSSYPCPASSIDIFNKEIGRSKHGKSPQLDKKRMRLADLYRQLGRYDEAATLMSPYFYLGIGTEESKSVTAVYWPFLWSDIARTKEGVTLNYINQLTIAGLNLEAIKSPELRAELTRLVKAKRFVQLLELVPMADQMDHVWKPRTDIDISEYPLGLHLLILVLQPEKIHIVEGKTIIEPSLYEGLNKRRPWKDALLRASEVLAEELLNLDRIVLENDELVEAWHKNREAALLSARGKREDALTFWRSSAEMFRHLQQTDALMVTLAGMTVDRLAIGTPESLLAAKISSEELIALHEERLGRLGNAGNLYQVLHLVDYRHHQELLRRIMSTADTLKDAGDNLGRSIKQELVLLNDRLQLRRVRRQIEILRSMSSEPILAQLQSNIKHAKNAVAFAASELKRAQVAGASRSNLRSGDDQHILEALQQAKPKETLIFEASEAFSGKPPTVEGGAYAQYLVAQQSLRNHIDATLEKNIGKNSQTNELPKDWDGLRAGMQSGEAIVIFLEYGLDKPLLAAVITNEIVPHIIELPAKTLLEIRNLVNSANAAITTNTTTHSDALGELARNLLYPLGKLPQRLTIVPCLELIGLPFEALPLNDGRPMVEEHTIRYALGLDDGIGHFSEDQAYTGALIIGAEKFSNAKPLVDSRQEVNDIRTIMSQAKIRVTPKDFMPPTGKDLLLPSKGVDIVHVSTHSNPDSYDPYFDKLLFPKENLLGYEMAFSRLKAKIMVLSACELMRNRHTGLDPVSGLTTASLATIAPRVLGALWEVDAYSTRIFMSIFYEKLLQWHEPAKALAESKRLFQNKDSLQAWASNDGFKITDAEARKLAEPYSWAGFVLVVSSIF